MKILLEISYLGSRYCGFQVQKNGTSVQSVLQDAVENLYGVRCPLTGCSRTDSGVHAESFFCTIEGEGELSRIPLEAIPRAMNSRLPEDISVLDARLVGDAFHPRYDVLRKEYCYRIWNREAKNPFLTDRAWHYPRNLDIKEMNLAAEALVGKHDFSGFMSKGSSVTDTVRTIDLCRVDDLGEGNVCITVGADGFLYNMVRIIVGTLIAVSEGKIRADQMAQILASCDRTRAGSTAPACGLYLHRVEYRSDALQQIND